MGVQKGWGVWESKIGGGLGSSPRREKISFKFECSIWPILAEMSKIWDIYKFFCQQGGDIPTVVLRWGGPDPPLAETLAVSFFMNYSF